MCFRFYVSLEPFYDKSLRPGEIELVKGPSTASTASSKEASAAVSKEDAVVIKERLTSDRRVALYGIFFDLNEAEVKLDSAGTIGQIAKILKQNPNLEIAVVSHTDNIGPHHVNMKFKTLRQAPSSQTNCHRMAAP